MSEGRKRVIVIGTIGHVAAGGKTALALALIRQQNPNIEIVTYDRHSIDEPVEALKIRGSVSDLKVPVECFPEKYETKGRKGQKRVHKNWNRRIGKR